MAKLTLSDLASLQNETSAIAAINDNNDLLETALENTLSRDGTSPNAMGASLDMNSNRILNLPAPTSDQEPVRLIDFTSDLVVVGSNLVVPSTTTSQAIARWGSTTGLALSNSGVTIDNSNNMTLPGNLIQTGNQTITGNTSQTSYQDLSEISAPSAPSANVLRTYGRDRNSLASRMVIKDSNNIELYLSYEGVEVLRPEDFGAKGDNSTDDYTAMQAMFDSISNVGVTQKHRPTTVWMRPGAIYRVSSTPKIQQYNVKVFGNFAGIKATGAANTALMVDYAASVNNVPGVYIENLSLQGATDSSAYCFWGRSAPRLHLYNLVCKDFATDGTSVVCAGGDAIRIEACVSYQVEHCKIDKPGGYGINVKSATIGGSPAESQAGTVRSNYVSRAGNAGVHLSEGGGHIVHSNIIEACSGGVLVDASFSSFLLNNYFESNTTDIKFTNTTDLVGARAIQSAFVSGNDSNSTTSLLVNGGTNVVVLPNRFGGNVQFDVGAVSTTYYDQMQQVGSLTDSSTTTIYPSSPKSSSPTKGIGYKTGAGGTVTQSTSKSTTAVLNTVTGAITMNNAALAAATIVSFTLTNSAIAATDVLILNHISGGTIGSYTLNAQAGAGSATINIRNNTAGSLSEAIVIQFAVIKGVNA